MPTYRVTGPDGATYEVTPPEGMNPSESEILAQVQAQAAQPSGGIADAVSGVLRSARDTVGSGIRAGMEFLNEHSAQPIPYEGAPGALISPKQLYEAINPVPGSLPAAGAMAGTAVAGPLGPLYRVLGAMVGAGGGSLASGKSLPDASEDAVMYGGAAGGAEVLGKILSWGARALPGAKGAIAHGDAGSLHETAGALAPGFGGAAVSGRNPSERLRSLVATEAGQQGISAEKERVIAGLEQAIGGRTISVPSLATSMNRTGNVPLREANDALTEIGEGLRHMNIADPTLRQKVVQQEYGRLAEEIRQGLDAIQPGLGQVWNKGQTDYRAAKEIMSLLENPAAWRPGNRGVELNTQHLQNTMIDPTWERELRRRLGDDGFQQVLDTLTRGAGIGAVDVLPAGRGGIGDAGAGWLRGGNSGTWGLPQALIRSFLPNAGASYVGTKPATIDSGTQILLDLLGERAMEQARRGPVPIGPMP